MASKFSQIPIFQVFDARGGKYRKLDDLYYEDLSTGFQAVWQPMFDESINAPTAAPVADKDNIKDKYLVDEQTRVMKPNPNYKECDGSAEKLFAEMWGTGLFDCNAGDYDLMALTAVQAVKIVNETIAVIASAKGSPVLSNEIVPTIKKWAESNHAKVATKGIDLEYATDHIWTMEDKSGFIGLRLDCGDSGVIYFTPKQAAEVVANFKLHLEKAPAKTANKPVKKSAPKAAKKSVSTRKVVSTKKGKK